MANDSDTATARGQHEMAHLADTPVLSAAAASHPVAEVRCLIGAPSRSTEETRDSGLGPDPVRRWGAGSQGGHCRRRRGCWVVKIWC